MKMQNKIKISGFEKSCKLLKRKQKIERNWNTWKVVLLTRFWNMIAFVGSKSAYLSFFSTIYQRGVSKFPFFVKQTQTAKWVSLSWEETFICFTGESYKATELVAEKCFSLLSKLCLTECFHWNCWQRHGVYHLWRWWRSTIPRRSWGETTEKGMCFRYK